MEIKSTKGLHSHRIKALIHGYAGSGKTHLASQLKEPTLIISAEGGLMTLDGYDIDVIEASSFADIRNIYMELLEPAMEKKYKNIFVDSLTEVFDFAMQEVKGSSEKMTFGEWGELKAVMTKLTKAFRDLRNYNVIMTALPQQITEQGMKRIVPAFSGGFKDTVEGLFDLVFYLENRDGTRVMHTRDNSGVACKSRIQGLPREIENPNLQEIFNTIQKGDK